MEDSEDLYSDILSESDLVEPRIFFFNISSSQSVSVTYAVAIVLAIAFAIGSVLALASFGLNASSPNNSYYHRRKDDEEEDQETGGSSILASIAQMSQLFQPAISRQDLNEQQDQDCLRKN